jgi:hypothetical protein
MAPLEQFASVYPRVSRSFSAVVLAAQKVRRGATGAGERCGTERTRLPHERIARRAIGSVQTAFDETGRCDARIGSIHRIIIPNDTKHCPNKHRPIDLLMWSRIAQTTEAHLAFKLYILVTLV